jgi:hypothetical protein
MTTISSVCKILMTPTYECAVGITKVAGRNDRKTNKSEKTLQKKLQFDSAEQAGKVGTSCCSPILLVLVFR